LSVNPPERTVADAGERALIERIRIRAGQPPAWVTMGIGDDAAVLTVDRGESLVTTVDSLVEEIHFRRKWTTPEAIGHKAVTVSLSDLAAMAAAPRAVLLSLIVPRSLLLAEFDALLEGVVSTASAHGAALVGGNIATSPGPLILDVTALGTAHPRRLLTRSGARAGDELFVTGTIGAAAAGLAVLSEWNGVRGDLAPDLAECVERYERPRPQLRCARVVAGNRAATACMDLSDGLADAARAIAEASGTGVIVHGDALPVHDGARRVFSDFGRDPVKSALCGGEDYELLFAVSPKRRRAFLAATNRAGTTATRVGSLTAEKNLRWVRNGDSFDLPGGYAHFG
jgi:thiamine-monophosphate kinase